MEGKFSFADIKRYQDKLDERGLESFRVIGGLFRKRKNGASGSPKIQVKCLKHNYVCKPVVATSIFRNSKPCIQCQFDKRRNAREKPVSHFQEKIDLRFGRNKYSIKSLEHTNNKKKYKIICLQHNNEFYVTGSNIRKFKGFACEDCKKVQHYKTMSILTWQQRADEIFGPGKFIIPEQVLNNGLINVFCSKHGKLFIQRKNNFSKGHYACKECEFEHRGKHREKYNDQNIQQFFDNIFQEGKKKFLRIERINKNRFIISECCQHPGTIFKQHISNVFKHKGCIHCRNEEASKRYRKYTYDDFISKSKELFGQKYIYPRGQVIKNINTKLELICKIHGTFTRSFYEHISEKRHCRKCEIKYLGERKIAEYLDQNNIIYEYQKSFEGLKNKGKLFYDFYIDKLKLLIEFNGDQHYRKVNKFGGIKALEEVLTNDRIKRVFAHKNGLRLLILEDFHLNNLHKELEIHLFESNTGKKDTIQ
ncbi:hypothetical protein DVR12_24650 [Chitinophaga silvatica]|uniref:DUF559 domain-containing protein n=1 Tax=Chitinophaga silvatica TaxID=2282649 RepID=A0A3E1Y3D4_9BACT|nr:hypothetical protein [Chitinophaga silvatica]RFS19164.1 hypothetical protein DVR12_24650 [Chitinophaga silvatica]